MNSSFLRRFGLWSFICLVSAAPSFVLGLMMHSDAVLWAAMVLGIFTFVLGYTLLSGSAIYRRLRHRRFVRSTLYIGYGARMFCSVVYPVGATLDLICGAASVSLTESLLGASAAGNLTGRGSGTGTFLGVYTTTIIQGSILNLILIVFMALVFGLSWLILGWRKPATVHRCRRCRYDIRASVGQCPECGLAIEPNRCRRCQYDLRASVGQCPECGLEIETVETLDPAAAPPTAPSTTLRAPVTAYAPSDPVRALSPSGPPAGG